MNALELIKHGIETQSWDDVTKGYSMMTGETPTVNTKRRRRTTTEKTKKPLKKTVFGGSMSYFDDNSHVNEKVSRNPKMGVAIETRTERREELKKINIKCMICGKEEEVHPIFSKEDNSTYRCNNCCGGK